MLREQPHTINLVERGYSGRRTRRQPDSALDSYENISFARECFERGRCSSEDLECADSNWNHQVTGFCFELKRNLKIKRSRSEHQCAVRMSPMGLVGRFDWNRFRTELPGSSRVSLVETFRDSRWPQGHNDKKQDDNHADCLSFGHYVVGNTCYPDQAAAVSLLWNIIKSWDCADLVVVRQHPTTKSTPSIQFVDTSCRLRSGRLYWGRGWYYYCDDYNDDDEDDLFGFRTE